MPLSQTFSKPISIHYGFPCFLNGFRITFCLPPWANHLLQDILCFSGATCLVFYVIALMGNSCNVKSEILLNYCEAGYSNWHYVKTLRHHFILCHSSFLPTYRPHVCLYTGNFYFYFFYGCQIDMKFCEVSLNSTSNRR